MNIRQTAAPVAVALILFFTLCFSSWIVTASTGEESFKLTAQSLDNLRKEGLPDKILEKLESLKDEEFNTEDELLEAVGQVIGNDQVIRYKEQILQHAADYITEIKRISEMLQAQNRAIEALQAQNRALMKRLAELEAARDEQERTQEEIASRDQKKLEQRVKELEDAETAREEATRLIIRDALSTLGSKINEFVSLGGTFEVLTGAGEVFEGRSERVLRLSTAQLDFEIQVNPWTLGSLIVEYVDGKDTLFVTSEGSEKSVDRINLDTAFLTIGDTQKFPPFLTIGRIIVPFGISTGNPVADVLTIEDPLTIEAFETKEDAILIGFGLPTPALTPPTPPVTPPRVRPLVIKPLVNLISKGLGYKPLLKPVPPPTPITPLPPQPPLTGGFYLYNGDTHDTFQRDWRPSDNYGATLGYLTRGNCGRSFDQLAGSLYCPWSIEIDVDYNNSVFDSLFLESEYQAFLGQIRYVPGMAASIKATVGPVSLVGEWNGALNHARKFIDDLGTPVIIKPSAWQVSLGYQFDWNPWVEAIGAQGNYLALGYSESRDLAGVTSVSGGTLTRIGAIPKSRFLVSFGEWILDGVRVAIEYSYSVDYKKKEGGTGHHADGVFSQITYEW